MTYVATPTHKPRESGTSTPHLAHSRLAAEVEWDVDVEEDAAEYELIEEDKTVYELGETSGEESASNYVGKLNLLTDCIEKKGEI